ncbi:hypothetical protein LCGC14_2123890, partial [marine sediment metagenome]
TILWGSSFIITKNLTEEVPIFQYLGFRFLIAFLGFIPFFPRLRNLNTRVLGMAVITGLLYFFGIAFQTYGLQTTTAGKAGFITGLSTVMVPFISWFMYKKHINRYVWVAVILSTLGMAFLLLEGEGGLVFGDVLVLICSFFWPFYIIYNDKFVRVSDIFLYSTVQVAVISASSFIGSLLVGEKYSFNIYSTSVWSILIYMGLGVVTLTFLFQNWSQQYQAPAQTAIIFTLEPVFAALFGFLIGNEILSLMGIIGFGLIFTAILITALKNY